MSPKAEPLSGLNWNFDKVPDGELVACCYWEYARESVFIREQVKKWTGTLAGMTPELWQVARARYLHILLLPDPKDTSPHLFPEPWQEQTPHVRTKLAEDVNFRLEPIRVCDEPWTAKELLEKAERQVGAFEAWFDSGAKGKEPVLPDPMQVCKQWPNGDVIVMLEISLSNYNVKELSKAFREWLNALPDVRRRQDAKRGKKRISNRVDLERLGIMRLLHRFTLPELRDQLPGAWKRYNAQNRRWQRDAEKARACFHRLFPFLPDTEQPLSWQPGIK